MRYDMTMEGEHFDHETGTLHVKDERITPQDYEDGRVGRVKFDMTEIAKEYTDFILNSAIEDVDLELACFTILQAMQALGDQGELNPHVGFTILSLSGSLYKAMKHNQELPSDERHTTDPE